MAMIKIEDYQLEELHDNKLLINIYDYSLKYGYELLPFYKSFYFDVIKELVDKMGGIACEQLGLQPKDYLRIIKKYDLKTDINDYIELTDYVTLDI